MPGATSNVDHLKAVSLPPKFQFAQDSNNRNNKETVATGAVNIVNERIDEAEEGFLSPAVTTPLIAILAAIALSVVLFHRFLPMGCKAADVFFAGDHFVEDTVRAVVVVVVVVDCSHNSPLVILCSLSRCCFSMPNACLTHDWAQPCQSPFLASLVSCASRSLGQTSY